MSNSFLVYSSETPNRGVKVSPLCPHKKDAGQTCYPCDEVDSDWLDKHYTGAPDESLDFREDEEMERYLWFGTTDNPIL